MFVTNPMVTAMFYHDIIPSNSRVWMASGSLLVLWPHELPMPQGPHTWEGIGNPLAAIVLLDQDAAGKVFMHGILPSTAITWWDLGLGLFIVWALDCNGRNPSLFKGQQ